WHLQVDRADPGVPLPLAIAIALPGPLRGPLVPLGPELGAHFRIHQRLAQHAHPFAQEIHILIHPDLAQGSQQVDTLPRGHRVPSFSVSVHTLRRTTRWPSPSTALALTHSLGFYRCGHLRR